ncbi:MAG TPA: GNAT family protein [Candidatus Aquilonibacter sp.]
MGQSFTAPETGRIGTPRAGGSMVVCRPPRAADLDVLAIIRNDLPTQYGLLAHPTPNSLDDVRGWIERRTTDPAALFFVLANAADEAVGFVQIVEIDAQSRHGKFGIAIDPRQRGRGYGRAAMDAAASAARQGGRLDKLVLDVAADNPAARLYSEAGWRTVGTYRRHHRGPDGWQDVIVMERFLFTDGQPQT